jgi:hypothetical protein
LQATIALPLDDALQPAAASPDKPRDDAAADSKAQGAPKSVKPVTKRHGRHSKMSWDPSNVALVVMAYNRPEYLERTLDSLLALEGVGKYKVCISQDARRATCNTTRGWCTIYRSFDAGVHLAGRRRRRQ